MGKIRCRLGVEISTPLVQKYLIKLVLMAHLVIIGHYNKGQVAGYRILLLWYCKYWGMMSIDFI